MAEINPCEDQATIDALVQQALAAIRAGEEEIPAQGHLAKCKNHLLLETAKRLCSSEEFVERTLGLRLLEFLNDYKSLFENSCWVKWV